MRGAFFLVVVGGVGSGFRFGDRVFNKEGSVNTASSSWLNCFAGKGTALGKPPKCVMGELFRAQSWEPATPHFVIISWMALLVAAV